MKFRNFFAVFGVLAVLVSGCATAPKKTAPAVQATDPRDAEIENLKQQLKEKEVEQAEAEARAAKAENDLREAGSVKTSKLKDPYLK